jgi:hypothetical protein
VVIWSLIQWSFGRLYFLSFKSVDRIEVTSQPQQATAEPIALARLAR